MRLLLANKARERSKKSRDRWHRIRWKQTVRAINEAISSGQNGVSVCNDALTIDDYEYLAVHGYEIEIGRTTWYIYWGEHDETQS